MLQHLSAPIWPVSLVAMATLALPLSALPAAQSVTGVQSTARKQNPKVAMFRAGDVYGGCDYYGPNSPGALFTVDPVTGSSYALVGLEQGGFANSGNSSLLDYDASLDRLVAWAKPTGMTSNNGGYVLMFVAASGDFTYIDLPAQTAPSGLACTGSGRTYIVFGSTLYYVDGMDPAAVQHPVMDAAGLSPYSKSLVYGSPLKGWTFDPDINALIAIYLTSSANCPGKTAAGIHVLRLIPNGTQVSSSVNADTTTLFWDSVSPSCDVSYAPLSLTRTPAGFYLTDVRFQGPTSGALFQTFTIDPVTGLPTSPVLYATYTGCPPEIHKIDAIGFSWVDDFLIATCSMHNFQPGGGLHGFPQGSTGCGFSVPGPYVVGDVRLITIQP